MRNSLHVRVGSVLLVGVAGLAMVGCNSSKDSGPAPTKAATISGDKAGKAMAGIQQVQDEINVAKGNVKSLVDSMTALRNSSGGGMQPAFKNFQESLATMQTHADKVAARSQDMQARAKEYREYWENEVAQMDNPELRAGAQERAQKVSAHFDAIRGKFEECRKLYQPFVKDCNDVNGYLSKELSASSLGVANGALDKGIADGKQLSKAIDDAIVELVSVSVKMSPETK
jgi:hypothetical protein